MNLNRRNVVVAGLSLSVGVGLWIGQGQSYPSYAKEAPNKPKQQQKWASAVQPKPLVGSAESGLKWLAQHQNPDGGWGQGEESATMRGNGQENLAYQSNVADSSIACLAMMRSGSSPSKGAYSQELLAGINYICGQVEGADDDSLSVTSVKGTRVQMKLGPFIDTFLASMVLSEAKGQMPDGKSEKRVLLALGKVVHKIEKNQKSDGTWSGEGWAPVLAQSMATKGLNRAAQAGFEVDETTLRKSEDYAKAQYDAPSGSFKASGGNAGVDLYSTSATVTGMRDTLNTYAATESELRDKAANSKDEKERAQARETLQRFEQTRQANKQAQGALVGRLDDKQFLAGFGSNGGEEFLSYMNISESLVAEGGPVWEKWDRSMTDNLSRIQNPDGSWSGHHCITGRTFCTASAILVLTADRAPVPVAVRK